MNIKSISSSSAGNCHIIESGEYKLLLDCGVSLAKIREAAGHDLSKIVGCLVSHSHGDHSSGLNQLEKQTAIPIYCTEGTRNDLNLKNAHILENKKEIRIHPYFLTIPIILDHDCECFGFIINAADKKLLYATDTGSINYTVPGLQYLMIEANYSFDILIDSTVNTAARKRIAETHLSIDDVVEFVARHKELEEIFLLHLSDGHSDARLFKRMVQDVAGVPVYVADK